MAITFKSSASCGDIIYALPLVRRLVRDVGKKATLYIHHDSPHSKRRKVNTYLALRTLLLRQEYIDSVLPYRNEQVDHDLDLFRKCKDFRNTPIFINHFNSHSIAPIVGDFYKWLDVGEPIKRYDAIFAETSTFRNYRTNLSDIANRCQAQGKKVAFVGLDSEYLRFDADIPHAQTYSLLDVALMVNSAKSLYCNQTAILTIAHGLQNCTINLAKDESFNNTVFGIENILI